MRCAQLQHILNGAAAPNATFDANSFRSAADLAPSSDQYGLIIDAFDHGRFVLPEDVARWGLCMEFRCF
jgi:hypothetical protein